MLDFTQYAVNSHRARFYQKSTVDKIEGEKGYFKPYTLLDKVFAQHPESQTPTDDFLKDLTQIYAASFTTVSFTSFSGLYFIRSNPDIYDKVVRELMTVVPPGRRGDFIDYATIQQRLPYLVRFLLFLLLGGQNEASTDPVL
jgi:hypothetical protein